MDYIVYYTNCSKMKAVTLRNRKTSVHKIELTRKYRAAALNTTDGVARKIALQKPWKIRSRV